MELVTRFLILHAVFEQGHLMDQSSLDAKEMGPYIFFRLYNKRTRNPNNLTIDTPDLKGRGYNVAKPLKIITHGANENGFADSCLEIAREYTKRGDTNVIVLDWGVFSRSPEYLKLYNLKQIGEFTAQFISKIINCGATPADIHLIGFERGATILGIAGGSVKEGIIRRFTGLNPMETSRPEYTRGYAAFVDIIHTYLSPTNKSMGHADFYPNFGTHFQPGCEDEENDKRRKSCSEDRSWRYFAESINSKTPFMSYKCPPWTTNEKQCSGVPVPMGEHAPSTSCGNYFLGTSTTKPFALGVDLKYPKLNNLIVVAAPVAAKGDSFECCVVVFYVVATFEMLVM